MGFAGFYRPVQPAKTSKTPSNLPHGVARTSEGGLDRCRTFSSPARLDNTVTLDAGGVVNGLQLPAIVDNDDLVAGHQHRRQAFLVLLIALALRHHRGLVAGGDKADGFG